MVFHEPPCGPVLNDISNTHTSRKDASSESAHALPWKHSSPRLMFWCGLSKRSALSRSSECSWQSCFICFNVCLLQLMVIGVQDPTHEKRGLQWLLYHE